MSGDEPLYHGIDWITSDLHLALVFSILDQIEALSSDTQKMDAPSLRDRAKEIYALALLAKRHLRELDGTEQGD